MVDTRSEDLRLTVDDDRLIVIVTQIVFPGEE